MNVLLGMSLADHLEDVWMELGEAEGAALTVSFSSLPLVLDSSQSGGSWLCFNPVFLLG